MPVKRIFVDAEGTNELEAYSNADGKLFISVGARDDDSPGYNSGFIVLDRDDLDQLIDHLMELKDEVFNDADFDDAKK